MTTDHRLPYLPPTLSKLRDLALNLRYTWDPDTIRLFQELGEGNWLESARNPIRTLEMTPLERLQDLAANPEFLERLDHRWRKLLEYVERPGWYAKEFPDIQDCCIAYFSAEFGLDAGLPMYSGGLGVLAGDHLKSASDLDLPLVAVGLLFRYGYFQQSISPEGAQVEKYIPNDWRHMPVSLVRDQAGAPVTFEMIIGEHHARLQIWQAQVGHVRLFLLDTDLPENDRSIRDATAALYPGDKDLRLRQEITLGIGGARALRTLGITPYVYHANEGHSIFLIFERLKHLMQEHHLNYSEALEFIRSTTVFTTHTPVPAGNELFSPEMLEPYLRSYADEIGISWRDFLSLGRSNPSDVNEWFSLTIAALKNSAFVNGVSALHGEVSRKMWKHVWPGYSAPEIPIDSITNGAHPRTWVSDRLWRLYEKHLGQQINDCPENCVIWDSAVNLPDAELWSAHEYRRSKLISLTRARLAAQREARAESVESVNDALSALDPKALTIGFARRFTSYKRGALIFSDLERLIAILTNDERPVQLIFSGKAHPMDEPGKGLVNTVYQLSRDERLRGRLIYLEDYDMTVARYLVGGCDVWLNN
ncbi:MAG TPA: alpha-glucan family phosphorylase, partial [candidate division Zixibacteria bacterium]|nr:alpha-glucan family phosphorylase [candidate division Zixibacteria bacterium]